MDSPVDGDEAADRMPKVDGIRVMHVLSQVGQAICPFFSWR
jgi:hypothetical protein